MDLYTSIFLKGYDSISINERWYDVEGSSN